MARRAAEDGEAALEASQQQHEQALAALRTQLAEREAAAEDREEALACVRLEMEGVRLEMAEIEQAGLEID